MLSVVYFYIKLTEDYNSYLNLIFILWIQCIYFYINGQYAHILHVSKSLKNEGFYIFFEENMTCHWALQIVEIFRLDWICLFKTRRLIFEKTSCNHLEKLFVLLRKFTTFLLLTQQKEISSKITNLKKTTKSLFQNQLLSN